MIVIKSVQIDDFSTLDMSVSTLDMFLSTLDMLLSTLDSRQLPRLDDMLQGFGHPAEIPEFYSRFQTFQPPSHTNLEVLKKAQKNLEIRTSNLETSKICLKYAFLDIPSYLPELFGNFKAF